MNLPYGTLQEVYRKTKITLEQNESFGEEGLGVGSWHIVLTLPELRALHMLLAQGLDTPDAHQGNLAANIAGEPTRYLHTIVVKSAAAVPGVQALLFLYKAVSDVEVSPAGIDGTHWQLTWSDDEAMIDLDFLRPHILPPKKT